MNQFKALNRPDFVFRRWSRTSFAVFNSLRKCIKIGFLVTPISLMLPCFVGFSQSEAFHIENLGENSMELSIEDIDINAQTPVLVFSQSSRLVSILDKQEIESLPISNFQDLLEYLGGIDLRSRGPGVQADVSMRGGSFDQTMILLDGINISDPQTGHFSLNLPINRNEIERIEVLSGGASRFYGAGALTGIINIVSKKSGANSWKVNGRLGQHQLYESGISIHRNRGKFFHQLSINLNGSDGYLENTDFDIQNYLYKLNFRTNRYSIAALVSYQQKKFGALQFYSARFPNQYEENQTGLGLIQINSHGKIEQNLSGYVRIHSDEFQLFRDNPTAYQNFHRNQTYGVKYKAARELWGGRIQVGGEFRNESILSNNLGKPMTDTLFITNIRFYNHFDYRNHFSSFFDYFLEVNKFKISMGSMLHFLPQFNLFQFYPGADGSYQLSAHSELFASINRSVRLPTFTEMYYTAPDIVGNPALLPEQAINYEFGYRLKVLNWQTEYLIFYRSGKNLIDWLWLTQEEKWHTTNISTLNTFGSEISLSAGVKSIEWIERARIHYTFLNADKKNHSIQTRYVLDYLEHNLGMRLTSTGFKNFRISSQAQIQKRTGSYLSYDTENSIFETETYPLVFRIDLRFSYDIQLIDTQIYIDCQNLSNQSYIDLSNPAQPGRWISFGFNWNLDQ